MLHLVVLVEPVVSHDEAPQPRHVGVGALPGDEEVVGIPAREGETADGRQRAQLRILGRSKKCIVVILVEQNVCPGLHERVGEFTQPIGQKSIALFVIHKMRI